MCLCGMLAADYDILRSRCGMRSSASSTTTRPGSRACSSRAPQRDDRGASTDRPARRHKRSSAASGAMLIARPYGDARQFQTEAARCRASSARARQALSPSGCHESSSRGPVRYRCRSRPTASPRSSLARAINEDHAFADARSARTPALRRWPAALLSSMPGSSRALGRRPASRTPCRHFACIRAPIAAVPAAGVS
jgi:hypothetical protein